MDFVSNLDVAGTRHRIIDLARAAGGRLAGMPHIHRILLENVLRTAGPDAERARAAIIDAAPDAEIPFLPGRVLMHDTTCGPALVDIAAMRATLAEAGHDPAALNPVLPVDVSTDHSLAVDTFARQGAMAQNLANEYRRNGERYRFMKWAAQALDGFRVHPPGTGIMHTLNLERLASVVAERDGWLMPDAMIGTDSHTPMINGIGVLAWGVGGIEAESVMFGMPVMLRVPEVVGVRLTGRLRQGVTATDLALTVTERLRRIDLADRFVEFFGPGVSALSAGDRAVVANMTPEFGANTGFFPVDDAVLDYLRATGRAPGLVARVEAYCRHQGLWFDPAQTPRFAEVVELHLSEVEVSVAGPRRPQDRLPVARIAQGADEVRGGPARPVPAGEVPDGAVAIAAITSCTNTTDPRLLIAAGLVAREARARGLTPPPWVKTSLAPGSPASARYLARSGLMDDLSAVGFDIVGFGCTTCIGNSGPLTDLSQAALDDGRLQVAVLSGNRNFPGRVHPQLEAGFLASPPLVVAFALAGDVNRDLTRDPVADGVMLDELWPTGAEIDAAMTQAAQSGDVPTAYDAAEASDLWDRLDAPATALFPWDAASTYIRRPPFAGRSQGTRLGRYAARPLLVLGDDITTDHISPAGAIPPGGEAGRWLTAHGDDARDLNVFSSRRGNWQVMLRGLYTNRTVRNLLGEGIAPGATLLPDGTELPLWQAAAHYAQAGQPVVIVAGERYGMGSSRDWAAKGAALLGARAVLAVGFERIHRANLIGMGVLPLRLPEGVTPASLALRVGDVIGIDADPAALVPRGPVPVVVRREDGRTQTLAAQAAVETTLEIETLRQGGLMPMILRRVMETAAG
ncbi:aconitate hydratase AcnA [Paracoccus luteus]|uniref:aconitate hydratase AcnA n=1 Tax=Paracoccus luteus TaxID=2508543 RepID=UPI00106F5A69|nr:aconitate hydratase AcnA [Paracoccus luteus]